MAWLYKLLPCKYELIIILGIKLFEWHGYTSSWHVNEFIIILGIKLSEWHDYTGPSHVRTSLQSSSVLNYSSGMIVNLSNIHTRISHGSPMDTAILWTNRYHIDRRAARFDLTSTLHNTIPNPYITLHKVFFFFFCTPMLHITLLAVTLHYGPITTKQIYQHGNDTGKLPPGQNLSPCGPKSSL